MAPRTPKTPAKRKQEPIGRGVTPVRLRYDDQPASPSGAVPRDIKHLIPRKELPPFNGNEDLIFMALDIVEEANGARFRIWGTTPTGASVLCTISDFEPYFYIAEPFHYDPSSDPSSLGYDPSKAQETTAKIDWEREPQKLHTLCAVLNRTAPLDSQIQRIEPVLRRPILYYRPDSPQGDTFLKIVLKPGGSVRRTGTQVLRAITNRPGLRNQGFIWRDQTMYEHEVNPLQRVLADLPCSGGAWLMIPPSAASGGGGGGGGGAVSGGGVNFNFDDQGKRVDVPTPLKASEGPSTSKINHPPTTNTSAHVTTILGGAPGQTQPGYTVISSSSHTTYLPLYHQRVSVADIEVTAPWESVICLTPDATQLADSAWSPFNNKNDVNNTGSTASSILPSKAAVYAAEAARQGQIAPVRLMVLDVCSATKDGKERTPVAVQGDPIVAISCTLVLQKHNTTTHEEGKTVEAEMEEKTGKVKKDEKEEETEKKELINEEEKDDVIDLTGLDGSGDDNSTIVAETGGIEFGEGDGEEDEDGGGGGTAQVVAPSAAAVLGGPRSAQHAAAAVKVQHGEPRPVVFLLSPSSFNSSGANKKQKIENLEKSVQELYSGAEVLLLCSSEAELLLTWQEYVMGIDPDVIALFQVGNTLETISQRFQELNLGSGGGNLKSSGGLQLSRFLPQNAKSSISIRRITMYSAAWVRSQSRMSSTSNQETFKADIDGRLVIDVLRQVLTSSNLASFSLVDCVQTILGETMEALGAHKVASLAGKVAAADAGALEDEESMLLSNAIRLARYSLRRTAAVHALLGRLATLPEAIEMARATGLTIGQDDAAEDPYCAIRSGLRPDYGLYWKNKIQKPLTELFATCLSPIQLQSLVSGPHTLVKVDTAPIAAPLNPPQSSLKTAPGAGGAAGGAGPSSPFPSKSKHGSKANTPGSTPGQRQMGMMQFFKATAKCLGCRRAITNFKGPAEDAPGLCESCIDQPGRWEEAYLGVLDDASEAEARNCAAHAACRQCHSGLVSQEVLCDNSECPVTYTRLGTASALQAAQQSLRRLDIF